ncbi:MAG: GNAT family N-acetyltransferase [Candidatus Cloacimonetes bacterium]|nr:GNAT family N-acetyltransferase [Candidatus Cloacimonadota bacterium]MBS3766681.1 GNAT family N-acetyltransferase [Candidatus Cloacimonadota bacterium]
MLSTDYKIRTMNREDIDFAIDLAANEGWNPGLYDAGSFYAADSDGFLVGELKGEPIGTISAVRYDKTFGFLGFYIVKPDYRGQGYGLTLWKAGMKRLFGRNVGLDGVVEQQNNYRKSAFKLAYRNVRYEGVSGGRPSRRFPLVDLSKTNFEELEKYDRQFFPAKRTSFLKSWINQPKSEVLGILEDDELAGYGMIRTCRMGYKIGPLFADNPYIAEALFVSLKASVEPGQQIYLDTPEVNPKARELAKKYDMEVVFETARMYTKEFPDLPLDRIFGVTTFELG